MYIKKQNLLLWDISMISFTYPSGQTHLKESTPVKQLPPFEQRRSPHLFTSSWYALPEEIIKNIIINPGDGRRLWLIPPTPKKIVGGDISGCVLLQSKLISLFAMEGVNATDVDVSFSAWQSIFQDVGRSTATHLCRLLANWRVEVPLIFTGVFNMCLKYLISF